MNFHLRRIPLDKSLSICKTQEIRNLFPRLFCEKKSSNIVAEKFVPGKDYDCNKVTIEDLKWRQPWSEKSAEYFKYLRVFYKESNHLNLMKILHADIDLSPSNLRKLTESYNKKKEIERQSYLEERNQVLGNELAAAHFTVHRGGAVKFHNENRWIKADSWGDYDLPFSFEPDKYIEAVDCTGMNIYYEGLENFRQLQRIQWLSLNDCENIDDWCLDQICGALHNTLVYLDLRNCPQITERGLVALWKMNNLRLLFLDDILQSTSYEMTIILLQEYLPNLSIQYGDFADDK